MAKGNTLAMVGAWAFTLGIIIALAAGFVTTSYQSTIVAILVVLGIIVGFLNVSSKETTGFLMASVSVMIALFTAGSIISANLVALGVIGKYLWGLMSNINIFVFPATIVVAMKAIFSYAKKA